MSTGGVLLELLDDLKEEEFERFKFFLRDREFLKPFPVIPKGQLEKATLPNIVDKIIGTYNRDAPEVVKKILRKISKNDLVEELSEKIPRVDRVEKLPEKIPRVDRVEDLQEKIPRVDRVEKLPEKIPRVDRVEDLQEKIPRVDRVEDLQEKIPRVDRVEDLQKKIPRVERVEDLSTSSTGAQGTGLEDSPVVKASSDALSVCAPDGKSSSEGVSRSPAVVKASPYALNTSDRFDHITNKDLIQSGPPAVYQLIPKKHNIGALRKLTLGKKDPNRTNRTILLLGETGAGKSTLVNALVNYAMGVKWEDQVWFEIVEQVRKCDEQKPEVIVYEIFEGQTLPYSLTIIDTPGYGDTRGAERDDIISEKLLDLFKPEDGVRQINAVGLVLKASENRLSDRLRYVFDSMASLFGNDMKDNIISLITHSYGRIPKNVLQALEKAKIQCAKDEKNQAVHFLFENCQNKERTKETKVSWDISKAGMREFTDFLDKSKLKKLKTTAEVLKTRSLLTTCIQNLRDRIKQAEQKQKGLEVGLKKAKQEMETNKNFMEEVQIDPVKEDLSGGTWGLVLFYDGAVNCKVCEETCHYPCTMAWSPFSCNIMKDGRCTACEGKCPVSDHVKEQWRYVTKTRRVQKPIPDVKEKYDKGSADHERLSKEQENLEKEFQKDKDQCLEEAFKHVETLEQIALNVDSLSTLAHLDFLIEMMKEKGDTEKVQKLEEMKSRVDEGARAGLQYKLTAAGTTSRAKTE